MKPKKILKVNGLHGKACALGVEEQLEKMLAFITSAKADFEKGIVKIEYMEECYDFDMIKSTIARIGLDILEE